MLEMHEKHVRLTFTDEILGTSPTDPEVDEKYIAGKLAPGEEESGVPDAERVAEEVGAVLNHPLNDEDCEEEEKDTPITVFPRDDDKKPFLWDYQVKGFFKDACGILRKVIGSESSKVKSYKKVIDGAVFIKERKIPYVFEGEMGECRRPLRAATAQGERIALARSETIPAGATVEFTIAWFGSVLSEKLIEEWLDYGAYRGLGQWRNSGKGRYTWEEIKE